MVSGGVMEKAARFAWVCYTILAGPAVVVGLGLVLTAIFWWIRGGEAFGVEESPPTPVEFRVFFFGSILSFAASWGFGVWAAWRWNDTWKQSLPFLFNLAGSGLVLWLLSTEFAGESLGLVIGWFVGLVVLAALGWGAALATPIEGTGEDSERGITGS